MCRVITDHSPIIGSDNDNETLEYPSVGRLAHVFYAHYEPLRRARCSAHKKKHVSLLLSLKLCKSTQNNPARRSKIGKKKKTCCKMDASVSGIRRMGIERCDRWDGYKMETWG